MHECTSRCNNDLDCEVCSHGVNIAQDECKDCEVENEDAKENMVDIEIKHIREDEVDLMNLPKPEQWSPIFTRHWFDEKIIGFSW